MDVSFQDRIDDYLLGRMNDADKEAFMQEVEHDEAKKEQLEFTRNMREAIINNETFKELEQFRRRYEAQHGSASSDTSVNLSKRMSWMWIVGVAAVLGIGFYAIRPLINNDPVVIDNTGEVRGGNELFDDTTAVDTAYYDSTKVETNSKEVADE